MRLLSLGPQAKSVKSSRFRRERTLRAKKRLAEFAGPLAPNVKAQFVELVAAGRSADEVA